MDIKDIKRMMIQSFFVIFSGSVLASHINRLIFNAAEIGRHEVTALLILSILADLAYFIFYSKKDLSKKQMTIRYAFHFPAILGITLGTASFMEWISWNEPIEIIVFIGMVMLVYIMVIVVNLYQHKKLAIRMNQKLKERYKG